MAAKLQELRDKRAKAVADARALDSKAKAEKRELTSDEVRQYDSFLAEARSTKVEIEKLETEIRKGDRERELTEMERELDESRGRQTNPSNPEPPRGHGRDDGHERRETDDVVIELRRANRRGRDDIREFRYAAGSAEHRRNQPKVLDAYRNWMRQDQRALQSDLDTAGGYLIIPEMFNAEMLKNLDDEVFIRRLARKFTLGAAASMGTPKRAAKLSSFNWGAELTAPTKDTALKFGKRVLTPHYMSGEILVSNDLLRVGQMNPETIVNEELARDAGELEEQAFMLGDGNQKPLGLFTASTDGVSTSRDISTGNTPTAVTFDGLVNAKYALKPMYRRRAEWIFHRDGISGLAKIKDAANQYIWQVSARDGEPDRLLGLPFNESEWCPNTFTTGKYVGILGDFSFYWITDALILELKRLVEKYAEENQTAFLARRKVDGAPVLEEAFARVKLG